MKIITPDDVRAIVGDETETKILSDDNRIYYLPRVRKSYHIKLVRLFADNNYVVTVFPDDSVTAGFCGANARKLWKNANTDSR